MPQPSKPSLGRVIFAQLLLAALPVVLGWLLVFVLRWEGPTRDFPPTETSTFARLMRWTLDVGALGLFCISVYYFVTSSIALWCPKPHGLDAETSKAPADKNARERSHPRS